jgi:hypothetical protein
MVMTNGEELTTLRGGGKFGKAFNQAWDRWRVAPQVCYRLVRGGVNLFTFNQRSKKTLRELIKEVAEREVCLELKRDKKTGKLRVLRVALQVKVVVTVAKGQFRLAEIMRVYTKGDPVLKSGSYALSETIKRDEFPRVAAKRGFKEEWKIDVDENDLRPLVRFPIIPPLSEGSPLEVYDGGDSTTPMPTANDEYPSSVYDGIWSVTNTQWYEIDLPTMPWEEKDWKGDVYVANDNGVLSYVQRI